MRVAVFAVALVALHMAPAASASTIILSEYSSDSTPASVLDATLDFTITDIAELTLSVTNDSTAPDEFEMNMMFFNATSDVTGLTLHTVRSSGGEDPPPEEWVLEVEAGGALGLIGPNGAGKSTLVLHVNGVLHGDGAIKIGYVEVAGQSGWEAVHRGIWRILLLAGLVVLLLEWYIYNHRVHL